MTATAAELGIDAQAVERLLGECATFPARWYFDSAIYDFELDAIWNRRWQMAATQSTLLGPGDFVVTAAGRVPILLARDRDQSLHAFVNVCPHRGFPVVLGNSGSGATEWMCKYHGWTFGIDGRLESAPGTEAEPTFDRGACGLRPVALDTWGEAIFVHADPSAAPLREAHPRLAGFAAELGLEPEFSRYTYFETRTYDVLANWKLVADNFLECYHCPTVHPTSLQAGFDGAAGHWEYLQEGELFSSRFVPDGDTGLQFYGALQALPGFLIIQHDDFGLLGQAVPTGVDSVRFTAHLYRELESDDSTVMEWIRVWDSTFLEDFDVIEVQQRSLRATNFDRGRYIPASEGLIIRLQEIIWSAYKTAWAPDGAQAKDARLSD